MSRSVFTAFYLALLSAGPVRGLTDLSPEPLYGQVGRNVAIQMPREHLSRAEFDDSVSRRAWTNYLTFLDSDHVYFTQADIARFAEHKTALDDSLKDQDVQFAYDVFTVYREHVRNRYEYVQQLLKQGFDFERDETYAWKRRDVPWPPTLEIRDELWRKRIKNEMLRLVVARALDAEESAQEPKEAAPEDSEGDDAPLPTPEEMILKRYKQALTVLDDSDAEWVLQRYLSAFTQAYDPHSSYMSPSTAEDFDIEMRLSLVGIGALLSPEDGAAKVVRLIPGGPAARDTSPTRLKRDDKIIAVAQGDEEPVDTLHWPLSRVVRLIRGEKGTTVRLVVIPADGVDVGKTKTVKIVRDEVKLEEQASSWDVREVQDRAGVVRKLGIVRLPAFYANMKVSDPDDPDFRSSAHDVREQIVAGVENDGIDGVLLDLRSNGGGSLLEAIRMVGMFIETGPAVQVRERYGVRVWPDRDPSIAYAGPLVVLVNRLSASASEIVAGALQDYGRAIVIGDSKTHGKGTVQTIMRAGRARDYGMLKLTTASYYRISGQPTQIRGVAPDIVLRSPYDFMELGEDFLKNPIPLVPVRAAPFTPVADLDPVVRELESASHTRRTESERFAAYSEMLQRVKEMNAAEEIPLKFDERMALSRVEREITERQRELVPDYEDEPEEDESSVDVVLDESLSILADYVSMSRIETPQPPIAQSAPEPQSVSQRLKQWLRRVF